MRILLVEDEDSSRESMLSFLNDLDHEVVAHANGEDAMEEFTRQPFTLVISDIRMPNLSGLDLLQKVKTSSPNTYVILITGYGDMQSAISALRAGAYDYLLKPIDIRELVAVIDRIDENRNLKDENASLRHNIDEKIRLSTENVRKELDDLKQYYHEALNRFDNGGGENGSATPKGRYFRIGKFRLPPEGLDMEALNRHILKEALALNNGNKSQTAKYLGITRDTLRSRLKNL